ncbi:SgcJ/EcaC family oxidoreductase [Streptomyces litchfieldiae]|uniref:SgcJ/EcaC family oxidoreductase n=1 Tax=Streptomyces litchfieldiae TaxID=3075543 RepID=A0ABU2MQJ6_9ACTN|nr:SgcJ/EcaC family oxidoreductase [Streptomyces sp. DSM 44938]MDT0343677.1 SgcJ/EcaC family oxidoreductase [Streptomyces sp. DSM 44938]
MDNTQEDQIRELFAEYCRTWTEGDSAGFGRLFTEDADYVSYDGSWAAGVARLRENHDKLFRGVIAGSAMVGEIESLRFVTDSVAVLVGNGSVLMPWRSELPKRRLSRQIIVCVRTPEGWRIAAIQNGRQRPVTIPEPDSMPSKMSQTMTRLAQRFGVGRAREVTLS